MEFLNSVGDAVVDRSLEELIGAIMLALALALVMAGIYALGRRKVNDSTMLVTCLTIVSSLTSMALAGGFFTDMIRKQRQEVRGVRSRGFPPPPMAGMEEVMARQIMMMADTDGDHSLSAEEAARAVDSFVRAADASGKGSLDATTLANSIRSHIPPFHRRSHATPAIPAAEAGPGSGATPPTDDAQARGEGADE
jgi:hypothetical protein